ncbi:hypothetical protein LRS11_21650 [Pseudomonas sp. J452]|uniref:hypothetical protein n=1 Tax=Pseudomonas sp. J452 TaxID=2898441 RepID=UPI0021AE2CA5|nr:hypothetical protein [Pseudomonas sp. J452]UUY08365.1 hypothetical protein LRS11_21650 [Pseudomonas sp. J452]
MLMWLKAGCRSKNSLSEIVEYKKGSVGPFFVEMGMVDLHSLAHKFRSIIDLLASNGEVHYIMKGFPSGCCGITSELLGDYLNSMVVGTFEYVWGELEGRVMLGLSAMAS